MWIVAAGRVYFPIGTETNMKKHNIKKLLTAALTAFLIITLTSCGGGSENEIFDRDDLDGATVGVLAGSLSEAYLTAYGQAEIRVYDDAKLLSADVRDGTLDCALISSEESGGVARRGLTTLSEPFADEDFAIPVSAENSLLIEKLNSAMTYLRASGELEKIVDRWESGEGSGEYTPDPALDTISVAVRADLAPYAFYDEEGNLAGLEIDVVRALCRQLELEPVFSDVKPDILLYMAESGKTSFSIGRIAADPENEAVTFTDPYLHSTQLIVVRK